MCTPVGIADFEVSTLPDGDAPEADPGSEAPVDVAVSVVAVRFGTVHMGFQQMNSGFERQFRWRHRLGDEIVAAA